jgi:hypothetical protein
MALAAHSYCRAEVQQHLAALAVTLFFSQVPAPVLVQAGGMATSYYSRRQALHIASKGAMMALAEILLLGSLLSETDLISYPSRQPPTPPALTQPWSTTDC